MSGIKDRSSTLNTCVTATLTLLVSAGVLVILGICNASLNWDIFSPAVESFLYAIFGSSVALAIICLAITLVLGISESVRTFHLLFSSLAKLPLSEDARVHAKSWRTFTYAVVLLLLTVTAFGVANMLVQTQRLNSYKKIAEDYFSQFSPKLVPELEAITAPPHNHVSPRLFALLKALDDMSALNRATVYISDPSDEDVLWGYTSWREAYSQEDGFANFYPAKPFEKAVLAALRGDQTLLNQINAERNYVWYGLLTTSAGRRVGVLRLDGNSSENFREYFTN